MKMSPPTGVMFWTRAMVSLCCVMTMAMTISLMGCTSQSASQSTVDEAQAAPAQADGKVMPTAEDRAMIAQYDALKAELDDTAAREIFNHLRSSAFYRQLHEAISQGKPVGEKNLPAARRYFKAQIAAAEKSRDWPAPMQSTIARASTPITLDGRMDEAAWQSAQKLPLVYAFNKPAPLPSQAFARMLWDETYLYVAYVVSDADIQTPELENDDPLTCTFDCVELFVMPRKDWGLYWEINASPNGSVYDALNLYKPDDWMSLMRIDQNLQGLVITRGDLSPEQGGPGYVVELAFPWDQLPLPGGQGVKPGDTLWGLVAISQLDIIDGKRKHRFLSHSPMLANFHNIHTMAEFRLGE